MNDTRSDLVLRPATPEDARDIARLIAMSSDGVAVIEWQAQAEKEHCDALDIGERNYGSPEGPYSWCNTIMAERDGAVCGMLLSFAMPKGEPRDPAQRPAADSDDVFAPYMYLEEPGSWYICGVAVYPEYRKQGIGTRLMAHARDQAEKQGFDRLSLVAFEQNAGSVKLYERLGYVVVDEAPVIPHPLIHCTGRALLMVARLG